MFKNTYFKPALLMIFALGVALNMTNPSEDKHKEMLYASLKKSDSFSSKILHTAGKTSDALGNIFGTKSAFVYKNNLFYSSLKIDNNNNGIADGEDTTLTFGILGNVFGGGGK